MDLWCTVLSGVKTAWSDTDTFMREGLPVWSQRHDNIMYLLFFCSVAAKSAEADLIEWCLWIILPFCVSKLSVWNPPLAVFVSILKEGFWQQYSPAASVWVEGPLTLEVNTHPPFPNPAPSCSRLAAGWSDGWAPWSRGRVKKRELFNISMCHGENFIYHWPVFTAPHWQPEGSRLGPLCFWL